MIFGERRKRREERKDSLQRDSLPRGRQERESRGEERGEGVREREREEREEREERGERRGERRERERGEREREHLLNPPPPRGDF